MSLDLGALENFEQFVADQISAVISGPGILILVDPQKNIVAEINLKIGKIATVIVPYVGEATDDDSGVEGTLFEDVPFSVSIFQNPLLVSSGPSARNHAEKIAALIKGNSGWPRNVRLGKPAIQHIYDEKNNVYQVNGITTIDGSILPKLPAITGAVAGGNVTLANAQPGAAIFYRTDGNFPTTTDTLYSAPFASVGQNIAARAWLPGFLASDPFQLAT
ncbi:MAG TPA: chitobiase/beta-hexosaminidase C-terminal domain-containing protein [Verrucomicrobiae bacterium]|nr:chitobiase/beta-hexosaminidase C-terminal domain-containing protein [Verrucomicrobiae bacterium]